MTQSSDNAHPNTKVLAQYVSKFWGVECNNHTWALMEQQHRTPEDDDLMLHAAHTSAYHWSLVGRPCNKARGQWMISRVNILIGDPKAALRHAKRCMEVTEAHYDGEKFKEGSGFEDWDLAFAMEAMARALVFNNQSDDAQQFMTMAKTLGATIKGEEDRKVFLETFEKGPWNPQAKA